jgi:cytochrome P450
VDPTAPGSVHASVEVARREGDRHDMAERTRADAPVAKLDFVNLPDPETGPESSPQPTNYALVAGGAVGVEGMVLVNSRDLVDETLRRAAIFSSADLLEQGNTLPLIPVNVDPPEHRKYRRLLDPIFAPRRIEELEADITDRMNRFIDGFVDRGWCDFTAELAEQFPSSVFLGMMGLPWEELDTLLSFRDGLLRPGTSEMTAAQRSEIQRDTAQRVYSYFGEVLDARAASPRDDILTELVAMECAQDQLTRDEVLGICFVLLTAGLDTVTDSLTCFFAFLAQHDAHRRRIAEDPSVIPDAVEELLRWETPVPAVPRWARETVTVGPEVVEAGHHVMVNLSAANLDPREFADPLEVRFDRPVNRHLAFGGGIHRCMGSHLARRELRIALREWHRRIPEYSLAPGYQVTYRPPMRFVPALQLAWPT